MPFWCAIIFLRVRLGRGWDRDDGNVDRDGARRLDVGRIFDLTGSYRAAFLNGLAWNLVNVSIVLWLIMRPGVRLAPAE